MKRITKIDASVTAEVKKTRAAAYCRVSTASDEQLISLEAQKTHYESYIRSNDDWEYAGLYYDEGITGTKAEVRDGLQALLRDCEDGKIDLIITKSINRFSRNTTDCLEMVRKLVEMENSKWSIRRRYQNGTFIISYPPYGYANIEGEMRIVPEEAEVVKRIFAECLAGTGTYTIAKRLNENHIPTKRTASGMAEP